MNIQNLINSARKSGDPLALSAYQTVLSAIQERENRENKTLDEDQVIGVVRKEKDKYAEMKSFFEGAGRETGDIQKQIEILDELLPKMLDENLYDDVVISFIITLNATSLRDMGKVMAEIKKKYGNCVDMGKVSAMVKEKLSNPA